MNVAVVGSGAWGTALALQLHKNGHNTILWTHNEQRAKQMRDSGYNVRLAGISLPKELEITAESEALREATLVVLAVPSVYFRDMCKRVAPYLNKKAVLVSATKGIESGTLMRMSQAESFTLVRLVIIKRKQRPLYMKTANIDRLMIA